MNNNYQHISHESLKPFMDNESEVLILGSFPSVKTREVGFYYGHPQNRFYKVLANIFREPLPVSREEKKIIFKKHHIALYDVIYECDIIGSSDSSIKNVLPINIKELLNEYPNINTIILNGGLAKKLFDKHLLKDVDKDITIRYCPSTSPANARMSLDDLLVAYSSALVLNSNN